MEKKDDIFVRESHFEKDLWDVIDYLQNNYKEQSVISVLENKSIKSFWYNLPQIIEAWFKGSGFLVLLNGDKVIGYCIYTTKYNNPHDYKIDIIEIFSKYRGKGYGKIFLKEIESALLREAKTYLLGKLLLQFTISLDCNGFWEKCGYRVEDNVAYKKLTVSKKELISLKKQYCKLKKKIDNQVPPD